MNTTKYKLRADMDFYPFTNSAQYEVRRTLVQQAVTGTKTTCWTPVCGQPSQGTTCGLLTETKQCPVNPTYHQNCSTHSWLLCSWSKSAVDLFSSMNRASEMFKWWKQTPFCENVQYTRYFIRGLYHTYHYLVHWALRDCAEDKLLWGYNILFNQ